MNQEKIGQFITELRKEKNMTQIELANKLGVTDRAISKWENGRGLPDLSLLQPLCKELNITINELLSGEKIKTEDYQEKLEENILNTIDYTNNKIKKSNKKLKIIFSSILLIITIFISLFLIDVNRMNNQEEVFFSTWGFKYFPPVNLQDENIEIAIKNYLINIADNEYKRYENEKAFVSMKIYKIEQKETTYNVYAWVLEEKHYEENSIIKQSSGSSIPHKFVLEYSNGEYIVIDKKIPRDGTYYPIDMKKLFPRSVLKQMNKVHDDGTIERLSLDINEQVNLYFHK